VHGLQPLVVFDAVVSMHRYSELRDLSVLLERETGFDSIPTIERMYEADSGAYECVFPDCRISRRKAEAMWRHVHFSAAHGLSFGRTLQQLQETREP
jgi:hypothetical protein